MKASHKHTPRFVHVAVLLEESIGLLFIKRLFHLRFRITTAATVRNAVLWDVTPCSLCKSTDVSKQPAAEDYAERRIRCYGYRAGWEL
jgi:hypothetical protein